MREAERPVKLAQYEPRSSEWCPSLIKTTNTRVIKGSEAEKLRQSLDVQKANREMADIARNDLADSDDEEVNAFGKSDSGKFYQQNNWFLIIIRYLKPFGQTSQGTN